MTDRTPLARRWQAAAISVFVWLVVGAGLAVLVKVTFGNWGDGFAFGGLALVLVAIGWAMGPFNTPMTWSEGTLLTYEGHADTPSDFPLATRWQLIAVPAFAFAAGILLLAIGGALAVA